MTRAVSSDHSPRLAASEALLAALARLAPAGKRAEDVLLDRGILSDADYALELALRSGNDYLGLRGFIPDERLFLYVPLALALAERVCPVVLVGDSLKLASAFLDPDLATLAARFPNLDVEIVVSPRDEILDALRDVSHTVR